MSKGSKRRLSSVSKQRFDENWDRIFGKEKPVEGMWPHACEFNGYFFVGKNEECSWCGRTEQEEKRILWDVQQ